MKKISIRVIVVVCLITILISTLIACGGSGESIPNGRFVATTPGAPHRVIEFRGRNITLDVMFGAASVTTRYTFENGVLSFNLEGVTMRYDLEIVDNNNLILTMLGAVVIEYVRE